MTSHAVTPAQQPFKTNQKAIDIAAYFSAVTLAGCAAWFSIRGMTVLFPGAPIAVVAMAIAMETAKLVTAGWLANDGAGVASRPNDPRGRARGHQRHSGLCPAGCRARRGTGAARAHLETQTAGLDTRIEVAAHSVADLDGRVAQIDSAIAEATRRGRATGAMSIMEAQRRTRAGLVDERNREAGSLAALKTERASLAAEGRQAETEAAPIRYVAELVGANMDSERAIRWLIALMVLCCDPLAIALTAAASARRSTV